MSQLFQDVAGRWKADKRQWVKPSSYATYVWLLNTHLLPYFADMEVIDEPIVQAYVNRELSAGLSTKTIRDTLVVLRMVLRFAEKEKFWPHMEFQVHFPTWAEEKHDVPILPEADQKRLLRYLRANFSYRNLGLLICLQTGLRIGELCALRWKDLDMRIGIIHVTKTLQRICLADGDERNNSTFIGPPKTASSVRDIPLSRELRRLIQSAKKGTNPCNYILSNSAKPLEPRYYRAYFRGLLNRLNIPQVRFHALRHTFASRCIQSRCDYKTVSALLGHASISTTLNLYVHPDLTAKKKAIERVVRGM